MALQVGALVSPNVALKMSPRVSGLNKNGKVGARAGFTIGWESEARRAGREILPAYCSPGVGDPERPEPLAGAAAVIDNR